MKKDTIVTIISFLYVFLAIFGVIVTIVLKSIELFILSIYLIIPLITVPIIYYIYKNKKVETYSYNNTYFKLTVFIFLFFYNTSLLILMIFDIRPLIYYLIISLIFSIIIQQIFFFRITAHRRSYLILEIISLCLNIIWGINLKYHLYIGRTDIIAHSYFLKDLLSKNYVSNNFSIYQNFPLWHILNDLIYEITRVNLSTIKIFHFTNGFVYVIIILLLFIIVNNISKNNKISILSCAFLIVYPNFIIFGTYSIPRGVISLFELLLLSIILINGKKINRNIIFILITVTIVLFHPASMPFIIIIYIFLYIMKRFYNYNEFITEYDIAISIIFTLIYWIYFTDDFFSLIISNIIIPAPKGVLVKSIFENPLNELINYLQYIPILGFALIGFLFSITTKIKSNVMKSFILIGIISILVSFPGPILLINKLQQNFNIERFDIYTFIFIIILSSFGCYHLIRRGKKNYKYIIILIIFCMVFLSISNDFVSSDNPLVKRQFYTSYLTYDEELSINRIAKLSNGSIMSDFVVLRYINKSEFKDKSHIIEIYEEDKRFIKKDDNIILLRKGEWNKRPLKIYSLNDSKYNDSPKWYLNTKYVQYSNSYYNSLNQQFDKVYQSHNIEVYY